MIGRALATWLVLLILAVLNGGVRAAWLSPRMGYTAGRAISSIVLATLILLATLFTIRWVGPRTTGQALGVGALWVGLTLAARSADLSPMTLEGR